MKYTQTCTDLSELPAVASALISQMGDFTTCLLRGELGAGKTTLTKEICKQLGVEEIVNSPTFSLVNTYELPNGTPVYHFDLYRLRDLEEALDIGFEEYLDSGYICLIEWPDKIEPLLEPPYWEIILEHMPQGARQITLIQHG